jgi:large subunit ribosomal protein L30
MATKQKMLKVKLIKSLNKRVESHVQTVKGLGLRRINHIVEIVDNACTRGMINKVAYMLHVEEI